MLRFFTRARHPPLRALLQKVGVYLVKVKRTVSQVSGCFGCPFQKLFPTNAFVEPKIGTNRRLVIAEAPGSQEEIEGEPLVGGAGRVAASLYSKAGIKLDDCTKLNVLQCRPPNNIFPDTAEARSYCTKQEATQAIQHCLEHHTLPIVRSERWELGRWQRIDLLGAKALKYIANKGDGIAKWRGSILDIPHIDYNPVTVPTYHPAAVMRDFGLAPTVVSDLKKSLVRPKEDYNQFPSLPDVQNFHSTYLILDIETQRVTNEITLVGISDGKKTLCVPFRGPYRQEIRRILLEAEEIVGQNLIAFDLPILCRNLDIDYP